MIQRVPDTARVSSRHIYEEARTLLEQADQARARVAAAGHPAITVGTLGDSVEETGTQLALAFRQRNPGVRVRFRETDFTDPTAGLGAGLADVALTRLPFDRAGISTYVLRSDPVGVVLRADDPLASRDMHASGPLERHDRGSARRPPATGRAHLRSASGHAPSRLVVAWNRASADPLIRSFARMAATSYRPGQAAG